LTQLDYRENIMDKGKIKEETFRELYGKSYASQKVRTIIIGLQRINNT